MPSLAGLQEPFNGSTLNTVLWNNVSVGAASLNTAADVLSLAQPTTSGATNTFGTTSTWDATGSSIYAQIGTVPTGNGNTVTIFKLLVDANNSISMRLRAGVFELARQTAGTTVATTLPAYDPHAHRWWRLREQSGTWYAEGSPDSFTWTILGSTTYAWSPTALQFQFQTSASATELAGQVATIQNINSILGTPINLNHPQIEHGFGARWNVNGCSFPLDRYADMSKRTRGSTSVGRGRQYETDQVQSGEMSTLLANPDGIFDPLNTAGPFYGHVQPYQPYRIRAQWPCTRNLLTQVQASGGDVGGYALGTIPQGSSGVSTFSGTDTSGGSIVSTATAWQGGRALQFTVPSGTAAATGTSTPGLIVYTPQPAGELGATYTVQLRVRNITPSTTLTVAPFIYSVRADTTGTPTAGSSVVLTGAATATWTTVTVTATLGQDAGYVVTGLRVAATAAATCNIQVDGWQFESGSTATPWTCPGPWYPIFGGFVERYPPDWGGDGIYGRISLTAVDAFALLSQDELKDPLTEEISVLNPRFLYRLDDPSGSTSAADQTGNYPAAQIGISKYGAGSLVFGTDVTATDTVTGVFIGAEGPVATLNNSNPGTSTIGPASFLKLANSGIKGPADPTLWTRVIAFRYTGPTPTAYSMIWTSMDGQRAGGNPSGSHIYVGIFSDGKPVLNMQGPAGTGVVNNYFVGASPVTDGNWHMLIFGYSEASGFVLASQDGATGYLSGFTSATTPTGIIGDNLGGFVDVTVGNGTVYNFKGDLSFAAEFPTLLTAGQITGLYSAWKAAGAGESTDARYARILRYTGYNGPRTIETGLTTSMGPAKLDGQDPVSALNAVVDTEAGEHFVAADGRLTFRSRSARYNATTPQIVLGERTDLGECPYEDLKPDYDATRISNKAEVTQESTGQVFYAQDATSIANFYSRPLTRTVNSSSDLEVQDAANYFLSRYRNPAVRMSSVKIHASALPAWWPQLLSLELGTRARVMRRPNGAPAMAAEVFIEKLDWEFDEENEAWLTLQCSPADITPYGMFAAWHTTLATTVASGVTSLSLNAPLDNVNPLVAQLAIGQQLTLDPGGANAETVTVSGVGASSSGWTTATVTLTGATTKAHTAGITVCEVLPAGYTDPTTWDANKFDAVAFAY
ncbi:hypothetical protein [Streptomyces sp. NBC_00198]|uniref:hypothetical protein n=1 Tax=Streptomyces sp. NBC_00198 TaxID=2975677 RepID=UPI00225B03CE|nr:hypothetical protein [Streptomyces sp. NBC_00198]MCX5285698.1 hypothetical protein [Streptomyces sp. NBC_00198]MCX5286200.1 hypothetical protein [Streptomyces sp. NBC_00198]